MSIQNSFPGENVWRPPYTPSWVLLSSRTLGCCHVMAHRHLHPACPSLDFWCPGGTGPPSRGQHFGEDVLLILSGSASLLDERIPHMASAPIYKSKISKSGPSSGFSPKPQNHRAPASSTGTKRSLFVLSPPHLGPPLSGFPSPSYPWCFHPEPGHHPHPSPCLANPHNQQQQSPGNSFSWYLCVH